MIKLKNKKTGEEKVKVESVKPIDYEFECEALADFAYQLDQSVSNKSLMETKLLQNIGVTDYLSGLESLKPIQITFGKSMYRQVKESTGSLG